MPKPKLHEADFIANAPVFSYLGLLVGANEALPELVRTIVYYRDIVLAPGDEIHQRVRFPMIKRNPECTVAWRITDDRVWVFKGPSREVFEASNRNALIHYQHALADQARATWNL